MHGSSKRPAFVGRGRGRSSSSYAHCSPTQPGNQGKARSSPVSVSPPAVKETADCDEEEAEDSEEISGIVQKLLQSYRNDNPSAPSHAESREEGTSYDALKQRMGEAVLSSTGSCLICYGLVKRGDPMWSCSQCYCNFHLNCIQGWGRESTSVQLKSRTAQLFPDQPIYWTCPKCRFEYNVKNIPQLYKCFCGKKVDPPSDPWLAPHSCGEVCSKPLSCEHYCGLLCHPGPCPQCPKTVTTKCYCGRRGPVARRCGSKNWSCGGVCRRALACDLHVCEEPCHKGPCPPCANGLEKRCVCGKENLVQPCGTTQWNCGNACGEELECGHFCDKICHEGACGSCSRAQNNSCPCGKTAYPDLPCTEEPPACGSTCGGRQECGRHVCMQRCHSGPCGPCRISCDKKCRCGKHEKTVPCSNQYLCDVKCSNMRHCGRHQCKRKCCDGQCLSCEQACNKRLSCRNHKCAAACHAGPCYPCALTEVVSCACGVASMSVPCGCRKDTKPPSCSKPCQTPPSCHHKERKAHRCHFGPCPKCRMTCNLNLACSHLCRVVCHSEPVTTINRPPIDPLAPLSRRPPAVEVVTVDPCPPCTHLVPMECFGKHETMKLKCSESRGYSCHRACGRGLKCGNHICQRECHVVVNAPTASDAGKDCEECEEACLKPRPPGCIHPCSLPCHRGPCPPCVVQLKFRCHCNLYPVLVKCSDWNSTDSGRREELLTCTGICPKQLPCEHRCPLTCHPGACKAVCKRHVTVRCPCKRLKKEVRCFGVETTTLACDQECKRIAKERGDREEEEQRRMQQQQQRLKEEEEETKQRMLQGRRRRRKKKEEVDDDDSGPQFPWFSLQRLSLVLSVVLGLVFVCFLVIILMS